MINYIEAFTAKTNRALDRNIQIQELLSEASMRIDKTQEYQDRLLRYVRSSATLSEEDMKEFCKKNQSTLDIILNEQTFLMDNIKNLVLSIDSYAMDSFFNQNLLSHMNHIHKIKYESKTILGGALPSEEYVEHRDNLINNEKGN